MVLTDSEQQRYLLFILFIVGVAGLFSISLIMRHATYTPRDFVGSAYTSLNQVPQGYAPPWNPFTNQPFLSLNTTSNGTTVTLNVSASSDDILFYKTFYVYDKTAPDKWRAYNFTETDTGGWIADEATRSVALDAQTLDPESWVLIYGCARVGDEWKCGCYNEYDYNCKKWSIQNFNPELCTPDPECAGREDGDEYCDEDTLISCSAGADSCLNANTVDCSAQSKHCITSGTSVSCADCAEEPPAPSTIDCGDSDEGTLCNGTDYTVTGEYCINDGQCVDGSCVECTTNDDCDSGHCVSNTCVECEGTDDCTTPPSGYDSECYTASCTSNECGYDTTSKDGTSCTTSSSDSGTCQNGECVTGCSDECNPSNFSPVCGYESTSPYRAYYRTCTDSNGDGCAELDDQYCGNDQYCDPAKGGCYTPSCGDGIKQGGEDCDEGNANGPCPATCSDDCTQNECDSCPDCSQDGTCTSGCGTEGCPIDPDCQDGDTSEAVCKAAVDKTTEPSACPESSCDPQQLAFDYGIAWIDPWPSGAEGTGKCCGDDANEWLLYKQGDSNKVSCCDSVDDCLDDYGKCYSNDVVANFASGQYYCFHDWWYACNNANLCLAHKTSGFDGTKECYYENSQYQFGDLNTPPKENCSDGKDNDCDGKVDGGDDDCINPNDDNSCGGHAQNQCDLTTHTTYCDTGYQACTKSAGSAADGKCYYCCADVTSTCGKHGGVDCQGTNPDESYYDSDCSQ